MKNDIIEELLSDLISKCEGRMTSPFKKNKAEGITATITPDENEHEEQETGSEESEEKPESVDDEMDPETLQKLIEAYKKSR